MGYDVGIHVAVHTCVQLSVILVCVHMCICSVCISMHVGMVMCAHMCSVCRCASGSYTYASMLVWCVCKEMSAVCVVYTYECVWHGRVCTHVMCAHVRVQLVWAHGPHADM